VTADPVVPLLLDLRGFLDVPRDPAGYQALWSEIEPVVARLAPHEHDRYDLNAADRGVVGIQFIDPASGPVRFDASTRFAIRGILEPPRIRYACTTCARYAPFTCTGCGTAERPGRVCDEHVAVLDLNFDKVTCVRHRPSCHCGQSATFWCPGTGCRRAKAWCDRHRTSHPGDPATSYCPDCYADRFPACGFAGCAGTGSLACEYADDRLSVCGARYCARHGYRWQIFWPQGRGLALCPRHHGQLGSLDRRGLLLRVVAGTALRQHRTVRHIFINVRKDVIDLGELTKLFQDLRRRLGDRPVEREMARLIEQDEGRLAAANSTALADKVAGQKLFADLKRLLVARGQQDLAATVVYSEYISRSNLLWVRVPEHLVGLFKGARHANVNALGEQLGVTIRVGK
jgi:hypothetical protein